MPDIHQATFGGLPLRGLSFSFGRGVSPSVFTCFLPYQNLVDPVGDTLVFSNGLEFPGCAVSSCHVHYFAQEKWPILAVHCKDRRWQWEGKTINGDYNRRLSDGTVDPSTRKSPAELANLLLQALGEGGFDTSQMPGGVYPRALWRNTSADLELQRLCDYLACEVVLNPLTDLVEIWPLGVGANAGSSNELLPKVRHAPRSFVPAQIQAVGGETVYQSRLKLQCALRNYDTGQQQLMADWSDKPDWTVESPYSLPSQSDNNKRAIEYEALYREFRITGQQDGSLAVPSCPASVASVDQYLLNDYLLETETDRDGYKRNLDCYLDGDYWAYTDLPSNTSSARYTGQFAISQERRIVKTPYPLFKLDSTGKYAEPALYLTTSYRVRDTDGTIIRVSRSGAVGGAGGTLVLRRPEVFAIHSSSTSPGAQTNTEDQANAELDTYIGMFQQKYANPYASEITYPGLLPGTLDGNIAQVTWRWFLNGHGHGASTTVCEGEELDTSAVDRRERQRRQLLARLGEAA